MAKPLTEFCRSKTGRDGLHSQCRTCKSAYNSRWRGANLERCMAISQRYKADNRERLREVDRVRYAANPGYFAAKQARYYATNREYAIAQALAWIDANRDRHNASCGRRRARKRAAPGMATAEQILSRIAYYGWRCWMCGGPWEAVDHVKPLARGGADWPANLRPACKSCNSSKRDRWPYTPKGRPQPKP